MPDFKNILYETENRIAIITLNRPERLNAMDHGAGSMQREIIEALTLADADADIGCVIVTGAGPAFSSGGYMTSDHPPPENAVDFLEFLRQEDHDNEKIMKLSKPVIAAVNGICYGAALMLVAHVDFVIASDKARFGLIETRFGGMGVDVLAYLVGPQWAKFLALTGEIISAEKAKEIGLVLTVVPHADLDRKTRDLARRVASLPRTAMLLNRRIVNLTLDQMGWHGQKQAALAMNAIASSVLSSQTDLNGRTFSALREEGWAAYKTARDAPFEPSWFDD